MAVDPEQAEVKAAGGVVWRRGGDGIELAVAHRPRYDDWSLPKGKLDRGESWEDAALREVEEEIGAALPARRGARAGRLPRPQGPRQGRALLADGARGGRAVRAQRRGRRDALADPRGGRRRAHLPPRRRARARRRPSACDEPRALPRARRRGVDPTRRAGGHADGRHRDRGDGRLDALRPRRQPGRRVRRRARDRRARRRPRARAPARCSARRRTRSSSASA